MCHIGTLRLWHPDFVSPLRGSELRHLRLENFLYDFKDSDFLYLGTAWQRLVSHGSPWQPMAGVRHPKIIYWVWAYQLALAPLADSIFFNGEFRG